LRGARERLSAKRYSPAEIFGLTNFLQLLIEFRIRDSKREIRKGEFRISVFDCKIAKRGLAVEFLVSSLELPDFPGGLTARVTPVPIPNTEVKPCRADDTALETTRERRSPPGLNSKAAFAKASAAFLFLAEDVSRPVTVDTLAAALEDSC
jgi:hypothetical protein